MYRVIDKKITDSPTDTLTVEIDLSKLDFLEKQNLLHFIQDGILDPEETVWLLLKKDPLVVEQMIKKGWYRGIRMPKEKEEKRTPLWMNNPEYIPWAALILVTTLVLWYILSP